MGASTCRSLAAPTRGVGTAGLTMMTRKAGELLTREQEKELKSSLEEAMVCLIPGLERKQS